MGNFAENLNLGNRFRPPCLLIAFDARYPIEYVMYLVAWPMIIGPGSNPLTTSFKKKMIHFKVEKI